MSQKRRIFSAEFKARTALELLTGTKTQAQRCREHERSPTLLMQWKEASLHNAAAAFKTGEHNRAEAARIAELERLVGRITVENDILKKPPASWTRRKAATGEDAPPADPCLVHRPTLPHAVGAAQQLL